MQVPSLIPRRVRQASLVRVSNARILKGVWGAWKPGLQVGCVSYWWQLAPPPAQE